MAEMKQPTDFPKSAISATCVMYATYLAVGYAGYRYVGPSVQSPITSELAHSMCSRLTNFLLFCHIIVAYIIEVRYDKICSLTTDMNLWCRSIFSPQRWYIIYFPQLKRTNLGICGSSLPLASFCFVYSLAILFRFLVRKKTSL